MYKKDIIYFGKKVIISCDGNCKKAWGINNRPRDEFENQIPDDKLGDAPENPGTIEYTDYKPLPHEQKLNRWCIRECERSVFLD